MTAVEECVNPGNATVLLKAGFAKVICFAAGTRLHHVTKEKMDRVGVESAQRETFHAATTTNVVRG